MQERADAASRCSRSPAHDARACAQAINGSVDDSLATHHAPGQTFIRSLLMQQRPQHGDDVVLNGLPCEFAGAHGGSQSRDCTRAPVHLDMAHVGKEVNLGVIVAQRVKRSLNEM